MRTQKYALNVVAKKSRLVFPVKEQELIEVGMSCLLNSTYKDTFHILTDLFIQLQSTDRCWNAGVARNAKDSVWYHVHVVAPKD